MVRHKKMDPAAKKKWLRALRGKAPEGEYLQALEKLYEIGVVDRFCCLGVLKNTTEGFEDDNYDIENSDILSVQDRKRFGVTKSTCLCLANMNDEQGKDFLEIADWIEENL